MDSKEILALQNRRYATKKYDKNKKISDKDWQTILEAARLTPSSLGLEPWKILLIKSDEIKEDLRPMSWGAVKSLDGASHFVIILARKNVTYDSPYVKHISEDVRGHEYDVNSAFAQKLKDYQEHDADLNTPRTLFDWASKQTYILLENMLMTAAALDIDSCPIEGFDHEKVEAYLTEKGILDPKEFGVSVMASFGYRDQAITPKKRRPLSEIYEVIN